MLRQSFYRSDLCDIRLNNKSICANCGGNHISSYKNCSVRIELSKKLKPAARLPQDGIPNSNKNKRPLVKSQTISNATVRYADMTKQRGAKHINANATIVSSQVQDSTEYEQFGSRIQLGQTKVFVTWL